MHLLKYHIRSKPTLQGIRSSGKTSLELTQHTQHMGSRNKALSRNTCISASTERKEKTSIGKKKNPSPQDVILIHIRKCFIIIFGSFINPCSENCCSFNQRAANCGKLYCMMTRDRGSSLNLGSVSQDRQIPSLRGLKSNDIFDLVL